MIFGIAWKVMMHQRLDMKIQFMMGLKNYVPYTTVSGNRWYQLHTTIPNGFYSGATMEDIGLLPKNYC